MLDVYVLLPDTNAACKKGIFSIPSFDIQIIFGLSPNKWQSTDSFILSVHLYVCLSAFNNFFRKRRIFFEIYLFFEICIEISIPIKIWQA